MVIVTAKRYFTLVPLNFNFIGDNIAGDTFIVKKQMVEFC